MTSVEFEKMLSAQPRIGEANARQQCLSELILNLYHEIHGPEYAFKYAREYTDALAQMMGVDR